MDKETLEKLLKAVQIRITKAKDALSNLEQPIYDLTNDLDTLLGTYTNHQAKKKALSQEITACQDIEKVVTEKLLELQQNEKNLNLFRKKDTLRKMSERTLKKLSETTDLTAQAELLYKLAKVKEETNNL